MFQKHKEASMLPIDPQDIQLRIDQLTGQALYMHLEMTTGAYAAHPASAFVSNAAVQFTNGSISGSGPYRVGLKTPEGWVYAEGLTHVDENDKERLIMAGHDSLGKLVVAFQLSREKF
jgi:hypothetical protein